MKRNLIIAALLLFVVNIYAQIPNWAVHPNYTDIKLLGNGYYVVSKDGKYGILNSSEQEVIPLMYDSISPFRDHLALLFINNEFVAYTNDKGILYDVSQENYVVGENALFRDGHLLVVNKKGYYFINGETHAVLGPYSSAFPFSEGYAKVNIPKSNKHIFDGTNYCKYLSVKDEIIELPIEDATTEEKNNMVDFISTVSNGKSIVVIKKRVYEYDVKANSLTPLSSDGTDNKKSRLFTNERPIRITKGNDDGCCIQLQKGEMEFDSFMRLIRINSHGNLIKQNKVIPVEEKKSESLLRSLTYYGSPLLGISYDNKEILPAQFESVKEIIGNEAVVKSNGKYGVVKIEEKEQYQLILNDNVDIGFEHKTAIAKLKAVCPPFMIPSQVLLSSEDESCQINVETRAENKNIESSTLTYDCTLTIPDEIDLNLTSANISIGMIYDGLKYVSRTLKYNAWYINNYSVEIVRHPVSNSVLNLDVIVRNSNSNNRNFFKTVSLETNESIISTISKVTEELYAVKIYGWKNDVINFDINVMEDGCPTLEYPFRFEVRSNVEAKQTKSEPTNTIATVKPKVKKVTSSKSSKEVKKVYVPN